MMPRTEIPAARGTDQDIRKGTRPGSIAARYTMTMTYINSVVDAFPWLDLDWAHPAEIDRISREWLGIDW